MRFWNSRKIAGTPKVGIAVASYLVAEPRRRRSLECLIAAMQAQTYANWQLLIVHDGMVAHTSEENRTLARLRELDFERIEVWETAERKQQFGHSHRQSAIERMLQSGCEWIGLTNDDNYYVPVYLEWMIATAQEKKAEFVYCDCVHSHKQWKPMPGVLKRGHIDLGSFLVHHTLARKVKFDKFTFNGDWDYINRLTSASKKIAKVPGTLFIHN